MKYLTVFCLLFLPVWLFAQEDCACCTQQHNQFDFWLGEWEVFNEEGEKLGENHIKKLENNCLVSENWQGDRGGSGKSFNYYDPKDETWNQLWVSNIGTILKLKGKAEPGKMVLKSQMVKDKKGNYYNQITWTRNQDGSVSQLWEIMDENDKLLTETFNGIYRKKD
ncbi:hypothetical protein MKO06_06725 [Gramella sp. GC03-9]|uniref:Uncharacterized protein n=1 Tax=Christiangramia oceanisediminis TaxID=2920386 RepID=A0A9X2IB65_9FLAO|nr:hypothetical protein [Gramella oceanisediminis]MCP9199593.1 hypothetical protein [Gramella oceanisediminis]